MKTSKFTLVSVSLLALGILIVGLPNDKERYELLTAELLPKTVSITCQVTAVNPYTGKVQKGTIGGSGVFISSKGHILTCAHLFNTYKVKFISVEKFNGWTSTGTLIFKDDRRDLALIKIDDFDTPYAKLEDPRNVKEGQEVIAIGTPLGLKGSVTTGVISATHRDEIRYDMIQMSAAINPGNSGGPLFNLKGNIVGINVNIMSANEFFPVWTGLGFSVSASEINIFMTNFRGLK